MVHACVAGDADAGGGGGGVDSIKVWLFCFFSFPFFFWFDVVAYLMFWICKGRSGVRLAAR